ncbi:DAK2 domain-containing protein [Rhizobium sp. ARZ01]|uniref:dihydroxyacetone kinase family protein n=1 Tax=Rhizobium sp. ARZ01 TaxID=2769313 RepID=UPI00177AD8C0|nr:DAK2 domain-containing protein [Rhizobium sp. ARZ01]MBD9374978.1 DAK2 domain-containing protein [Rhizobium sp. ARZ01]
MDAINAAGLIKLFEALKATFAEQREFLIALDGKVGDSDLGITMSKSFAAAYDTVVAEGEGASIAKLLKSAGVIMAKTAPSTMGTLTATGFLRGGKALDEATAIGTAELAAFWRAFADGVAERGKAKVGDKTLLDVLDPIARSMEASAADGASLASGLSAATRAAAEALENTKTMVAQHGKAAAFQEKSRGLQDAGATVGLLIVQTMHNFVAA